MFRGVNPSTAKEKKASCSGRREKKGTIAGEGKVVQTARRSLETTEGGQGGRWGETSDNFLIVLFGGKKKLKG